MFFAKRKPTVYVTKLYFTCDLASEIDFTWIGSIFNVCASDPVRYSINFGSMKAISAFGDADHTLTFGDVEDIDIIDEHGRTIVGIGIAGKAFGAMDLFECVVVSRTDQEIDKSLILFEWLSSRFHLYYGYRRALRGDYLPATESKMKRGLLGAITVSVGKVEDSWLFSPSEIKLGAIKGVYPVNFWSEKAIGKLEDIGFNLPSHRIIESGVVAFSEAECIEIYKRNPKYTKYMHFSDID